MSAAPQEARGWEPQSNQEPQQLDEDGSDDVRGCPREGIRPVCVPVSHLCDMLAKSTELFTGMLRANGPAEAEIGEDAGADLGLHLSPWLVPY